jgi:hypothetical protein
MIPKRTNPPGKDTTLPVAKVASRLMKHPETATNQEIKKVAAAALSNTIPRKPPGK